MGRFMTSSPRRHHLSARVLPDESDRLRGRVIDMASYRSRLDMRDHDSILNALWNELSRLAHDAWTWRDPDSLEALEFHLAILKAHVHAEWER
jgi:hypothetical protein